MRLKVILYCSNSNWRFSQLIAPFLSAVAEFMAIPVGKTTCKISLTFAPAAPTTREHENSVQKSYRCARQGGPLAFAADGSNSRSKPPTLNCRPCPMASPRVEFEPGTLNFMVPRTCFHPQVSRKSPKTSENIPISGAFCIDSPPDNVSFIDTSSLEFDTYGLTSTLLAKKILKNMPKHSHCHKNGGKSSLILTNPDTPGRGAGTCHAAGGIRSLRP